MIQLHQRSLEVIKTVTVACVDEHLPHLVSRTKALHWLGTVSSRSEAKPGERIQVLVLLMHASPLLVLNNPSTAAI